MNDAEVDASAVDFMDRVADAAVDGRGSHVDDCNSTPAPKKKRKSSTSPTQRTLAECKKRGWIAQVVERWNPHARVRQDLFGVIDLIALRYPEAGIIGIQACAGASHADRRAKILAEPRALAWVEAGGKIELWSWSKRGDRGKRKLLTLRVEAFTVDDWGTP